jgi:hypothetical protein
VYDDSSPGASTFGYHTLVDRTDLSPIFSYFISNSLTLSGSGIWLVHWHSANYATSPSIFYKNNPGECQSYTNGFYRVGSARVVRDVENGKVPISLNVYSGVNWTNNGTTFEVDQPIVSSQFCSLILTGNKAVQLFLVENYSGFSYCFQADSAGAYSTLGNISTIGLRPGDVKSLKFGCTSADKIIQL